MKTLSGPTHFEYFPDINGKRLLLLGERHNIENICKINPNIKNVQEVHNWLLELAMTTPTCLDLFVETYINEYYQTDITKPLNEFNSPLTAIRQKFEFCNLTKGKNIVRTKCPIDNLRYHLVDVRELESRSFRTDESYTTFDDLNKMLVDKKLLLAQIDMDTIKNILTVNYDNIINYISGLYEDQIGKKMYYKILEIMLKNYDKEKGIFSKLLFKSKYKKYIESYENYRINYLKLINKQKNKIKNLNTDFFMDCLKNAYKEITSSYKDIFIKFYITILDINMDVYCLLRYLHVYDNNKLERGPEKCRSKEFNQNKYSIIYGGSAHIITYGNFFKEYYNIEPEIRIANSVSSCITLPKEFDFFENLEFKEEPILDTKNLKHIFDEFFEVELLGQGAFGKAYKAFNNISKKYVVIKEISFNPVGNKNGFESLEKLNSYVVEVKNMELLKNNCTIYFACYISSKIDFIKQNLYIVMEYLENYIPLDKYIHKLRKRLFGNDKDEAIVAKTDFKEICTNLCKGLKLMHADGLAHNDIKPENIMVNPDTNNVKYIDFGLSCKEDVFNSTIEGTLLYMDPLIYLTLYKKEDDKFFISKEPKYFEMKKQGDLWSLGCVIYVMYFGETPFIKNYLGTMDNYKDVYIKIYEYYLDPFSEELDNFLKIMNINLHKLLTRKKREYVC